MTDEQIIKALECCINGNCDDCYNVLFNCMHNAITNALDLINRQRAENKKLEIELKAMRGTANTYKKWYHEAKSEAIREFGKFLIDKSKDGKICVSDIPDYVKK